MHAATLLSLPETESRVCDIAAEHLGIHRAQVYPRLRVIQDLHCDSLELVELWMAVEDAFDVDLPNDSLNPVYKTVFTRDPFRLSDIAELVYLQQGWPRVKRVRWQNVTAAPASSPCAFTQLGGRAESVQPAPLFESVGQNQQHHLIYRRRTDGMVCVALPGGEVMLGADGPDAAADERPIHRARLDAFLIDREPVSTTAYCRFLNSIGPLDPRVLEKWFVLPPTDRRREHELIRCADGSGWTPLPGTERMPMMLVSWYGASAYSLWANRRDWRACDDDNDNDNDHDDDDDETFDGECLLPSEAQWEYAARGPEPRRFPWGDDDAAPARMRYAQHVPGRTYAAEALPLADVNEPLGLSPFGLHHMAGNVWQWCRDWYAHDFYATRDATSGNPVNRTPSRVRSERGGSWIGAAALCRSSYRRGRVPRAKGRCLGFRCVSDARDAVP